MEKRRYKAELLLKHDRGLGPVFKKTIYLEAESVIDARVKALDAFSEEYGAKLQGVPLFVEPVKDSDEGNI